MIEFRGSYFDGKSSRAYLVTASCDGERLMIRSEGDELTVDVPLRDCAIAPPLGRTERALTLPDGARCETPDLQAVAALEDLGDRNRGMRLVHLFESRWTIVLGCLAGLILAVWAFTAYGIPLLASQAAFATPRGVVEGVSQRTLAVLDDRFLDPSELEPRRADRIHEQFDAVARDLGGGADYRLVFRGGGLIGANALALPSGLIVVTDELVDLAESDRQLLAVLAHEIAHVEERHGLRSIYQGAGVFLLISVLAGDVTTVTSLAASLPTLLVESGYSRKFERQADEVAGRYLLERGWGTRPLRVMLERLSAETGEPFLPALISSHPDTTERIANLQELERRESAR